MQPEQQTQQAVTAPQSAPEAQSSESTPIKKQHGGKRAGAGRKPDLVKRMVARLTPATAREVLAAVDVEKVIKDIFANGSLTLKQRTLADLWDRAYGRPAQALSVSGGIVLAHDWRPLEKYGLTDEELAVMLKARMKLEAQSQNTPQNAPGFQDKSTVAIEAPAIEESSQRAGKSLPESKPAIEAEVVESEARDASERAET